MEPLGKIMFESADFKFREMQELTDLVSIRPKIHGVSRGDRIMTNLSDFQEEDLKKIKKRTNAE